MIGIWVGKIAALALRMAGRNATSFPGKAALRVSPRVLSRLAKQLSRCLVVTGTNGKTTTSALLASMIEIEGPIIHNAEGANMTQGIVTALLNHTNWFGRLRRSTAVLEIDEATLPLLAGLLPVQVLVVTNVFRDQLDRYGELDVTMQKIQQGIRATNATVVLNGDDPLARHIGLTCGKTVYYFGMSEANLQSEYRDQMRDGAFCLQCGHALGYSGFFYGQLGQYQCPNCEFQRPHPDFQGTMLGHQLSIEQSNLPEVRCRLPVRGIFNQYNGLCAIAAARVYGLSGEQIEEGLQRFVPPLGRMQAFDTVPPSVLNLIKNPTGCDSVLQAVLAEPGRKVLCIAINDQAADGKDVSWLWDADFELIQESSDVVSCVATGTRAEDMALRLKYAGVRVEQIDTLPDSAAGLNRAFERAMLHGGLPVYVISTYTALYPMAERLRERMKEDESKTSYRASVS